MGTYRKHLVVYIGPILRMLLWLAALAALAAFFASNVPGASMRQPVGVVDSRWTIQAAVSAIAALLIARDFYTLLVLKSVSITVTGSGVEYRKGVLPWKKVTYFWHPKQIFGAGHSHGFLGWLLKAGTVHITGTEGTTSRFAETWISRANKCAEEINALTVDRSARTAAVERRSA